MAKEKVLCTWEQITERSQKKQRRSKGTRNCEKAKSKRWFIGEKKEYLDQKRIIQTHPSPY